MTHRVALYARYSSDRQNERSIADQVAVMTDMADRRGWTVVASYMDAAISGQAMANRPGLLNAIAAAERGEYDVLMVEDEDRIARDEEHQWNVYNRLGAAGVFLSTLSAERVSRMQVAFKSFMAAEYVQVLSTKTKRGLASNAAKGLSTGGKLYGYRTQPGGATTIEVEEAAVIRRIFSLYTDDQMTPREIAAVLNAEAVPSPRGGQWNASSINGSAQRGNGILHSEIYGGTKVFGRVERRKDRTTGQRATIIRPASEHTRVAVPDLAIISRDLWDRTQTRLASRTVVHVSKLAGRRRPQSLLSGLVRCGCCGGSFTALNKTRMQCSAFRERGKDACPNRRIVQRHIIENRVLTGLKDQLLSGPAVAAYVRIYHEEWQRQATELRADRQPLERRLGEVERAIARGVDAVLSGAVKAEAMGRKLEALEAEQSDLKARLVEIDGAQAAPILLHPRAGESFAARVEALHETLAEYAASGTTPDRAALDSVRDLIDRIEITPESPEYAAPVRISLHGKLEQFLSPTQRWGIDGAPGGVRTQTHLRERTVKIAV